MSELRKVGWRGDVEPAVYAVEAQVGSRRFRPDDSHTARSDCGRIEIAGRPRFALLGTGEFQRLGAGDSDRRVIPGAGILPGNDPWMRGRSGRGEPRRRLTFAVTQNLCRAWPKIAVKARWPLPTFVAMRIAVFSDTHDKYPPRLPEMMRGADELWHLGDVCEPTTLVEFTRLGVPLLVVQGNCDSHFEWPIALELEREGMRFHLAHIPPERAPKGVQAVLHGHMHVPRDEMIGSVRWLNPGCVSRPNRGAPPSFGWLTLERGKPIGWEIVKLQ
jgi:uncharacterized protein